MKNQSQIKLSRVVFVSLMAIFIMTFQNCSPAGNNQYAPIDGRHAALSSNIPWSGIIDPSRAVDWSNAGIPGGLPNRTTQCGPTIVAYSGSAATINSAIATCPAGQFVSLGAGTFNLTSGIDFTQHNNVTLRGAGANQTLLVFSGAGAGGYNSVIAMEGSVSANGYENNVCDWTAGYSQGSNVITLANCGNTTPAKGSLSNLKVGSLLILDQVDEAADTGTIWNCATENTCSNTIQGGEARTNGPSVTSISLRSQQQGVVVTAINGNQVTVSPGLYMPNWRSGQLPQAWFASTTVTSDGVEALSIDATNSGSGQTIMIANATQSWVKGIRGIYANRSHVRTLLGSHIVVQDSYFYQNISHQQVSYGAELMGGWDSLIQNNIFQQDTDSEPSCSGACAGNVIAYNYDVNNVYTTPGWMQAGFYQHSAGDVFNLWEGNIGPGYDADAVHGTHHFETVFRNRLIGNNQSLCDGAPCSAQTTPVILAAGSRYFNVVGNVLGQSGYHHSYSCDAMSSSSCVAGNSSIYNMGYTGNGGQPLSSITGFCSDPSCTSRGDFDPMVGMYLFRWGNYDTVNTSVQWNSIEVPTGIASYSNPVPSSQTLPASLYLAAEPSWFGSVPYPPIGPDVTGGNISGVGGHANNIPAAVCYATIMAGPSDGTGGVLSFNAATCYSGASPTPAPSPTPSPTPSPSPSATPSPTPQPTPTPIPSPTPNPSPSPTPVGPTTTIISPVSGAVVPVHSTTSMKATASEVGGIIAKFEFYVNGKLTCTRFNGPNDLKNIDYQCNFWVVKKPQIYTLQTVAYDQAGNKGVFKSVIASQ